MSKSCKSCKSWADRRVVEKIDERGFKTHMELCPVWNEEVRRPEIYWCREYRAVQQELYVGVP